MTLDTLIMFIFTPYSKQRGVLSYALLVDKHAVVCTGLELGFHVGKCFGKCPWTH